MSYLAADCYLVPLFQSFIYTNKWRYVRNNENKLEMQFRCGCFKIEMKNEKVIATFAQIVNNYLDIEFSLKRKKTFSFLRIPQEVVVGRFPLINVFRFFSGFEIKIEFHCQHLQTIPPRAEISKNRTKIQFSCRGLKCFSTTNDLFMDWWKSKTEVIKFLKVIIMIGVKI